MGELGVGKIVLVYGLVVCIEVGNVFECFIGCCIYELDLGNLLVGI